MGRIISFYGADHKCGTSMISLCEAQSIAKLCPSLNILLINLNDKNSEAYSPRVSERITKIWPYMDEQILNLDELVKKALYEKNLSIIGGTDISDSEQNFTPEGCQYLLNSCRERYDIIICDCGCEITKSLCLGALFSSDEINLVLEQTESCLRRIEMEKSLFDKLGIVFSYFVINKYNRDNIYTKDYCIQRLGIEETKLYCAADSDYGDIAEMKSKSLLEFKNVAFKKSIEKISRRIISDYGRL